MEVNSIASARQLEQHPPTAESVEVRVRSNDRITIASAIRQVSIERMAILGRPSDAVLGQFLGQLEPTDVDVLVNMVKFTLKTAVRSYRYVMTRFRNMVRASKCIRLFWLGSRFRFASKLQRLILLWRRDEDDARRKLLNRSSKKATPTDGVGTDNKAKDVKGAKKGTAGRKPNNGGGEAPVAEVDEEDDDFVLQQFISLQAPVELKRRVLMRHYKLLAAEFRSRWRKWREKKAMEESLQQMGGSYGCGDFSGATFEMDGSAMSEGTTMNNASFQSGGGGAKEGHRARSNLPAEPRFRWYEQLATLSARERFEMCLQYQLRKKNAATGSGGGYSEDGGQDDGWIALSLAACARHARQIEERAMHGVGSGGKGGGVGGGHSIGPSITYLPKFSNVKARVMDKANASGDQANLIRRVNRFGEVETTLPSSSTVITATRMLDLKAELPTLARFKCEPWNLPPRHQGKPNAARALTPGPSGGVVGGKRGGHNAVHHNVYSMYRDSEAGSLAQLDPFAKSLVLRGVLRPPARAKYGPRSKDDVHRHRSQLMTTSSLELSAKYRSVSSAELIKGDRFRQMLYNQKAFGVE